MIRLEEMLIKEKSMLHPFSLEIKLINTTINALSKEGDVL